MTPPRTRSGGGWGLGVWSPGVPNWSMVTSMTYSSIYYNYILIIINPVYTELIQSTSHHITIILTVAKSGDHSQDSVKHHNHFKFNMNEPPRCPPRHTSPHMSPKSCLSNACSRHPLEAARRCVLSCIIKYHNY